MAHPMADVDLKPLPKLSDETLEEISDAIVSGYDIADLSRLLRFKWGFVLANYIDTRQGFRFVIADLVAWTERKGKTRELLALAYSDAPGNENLQAVAAKIGLTLPHISMNDAARRVSLGNSLETVGKSPKFVRVADRVQTRISIL